VTRKPRKRSFDKDEYSVEAVREMNREYAHFSLCDYGGRHGVLIAPHEARALADWLVRWADCVQGGTK